MYSGHKLFASCNTVLVYVSFSVPVSLNKLLIDTSFDVPVTMRVPPFFFFCSLQPYDMIFPF